MRRDTISNPESQFAIRDTKLTTSGRAPPTAIDVSLAFLVRVCAIATNLWPMQVRRCLLSFMYGKD